MGYKIDVRFQEAIAVAVDGLDRVLVCDTDMVGLNANHRSQPSMFMIDQKITFPTPAGPEEPQVGECGWKRSRDPDERAIRDEIGV